MAVNHRQWLQTTHCRQCLQLTLITHGGKYSPGQQKLKHNHLFLISFVHTGQLACQKPQGVQTLVSSETGWRIMPLSELDFINGLQSSYSVSKGTPGGNPTMLFCSSLAGLLLCLSS